MANENLLLLKFDTKTKIKLFYISVRTNALIDPHGFSMQISRKDENNYLVIQSSL